MPSPMAGAALDAASTQMPVAGAALASLLLP